MLESVKSVAKSSFAKGFYGGMLGMGALLLVLAICYSAWTLYVDHRNLNILLDNIRRAQQQQQMQSQVQPSDPSK